MSFSWCMRFLCAIGVVLGRLQFEKTMQNAHIFGVLWTSCDVPAAAGVSKDIQLAKRFVLQGLWNSKRPPTQLNEKPHKIENKIEVQVGRGEKKREMLGGPAKGSPNNGGSGSGGPALGGLGFGRSRVWEVRVWGGPGPGGPGLGRPCLG